MGVCSNEPFTSEQKNQIQSMVNAALQGTATPDLTEYVRQYTDQQAKAGIDALNSKYATICPKIAERTVAQFQNNTEPPQWTNGIVKSYNDDIISNVQSSISLDKIQQKCSVAPAPAPSCSVAQLGAAAANQGFRCEDNTCTLTLFDDNTILYIPSNVMIDGNLTVDKTLTAQSITGNITSNGNTC